MCQKDIYRRALEKRIFQKNDLKSNFFPCPLFFFFLFALLKVKKLSQKYWTKYQVK